MTKVCKVLLVEDQPEIQELLRELFASEGYRFIVVGNGAAMRSALEREPDIDIVVIDLLLPGGVDGFALASEVTSRGLPVILVTGDHRYDDQLTASGHRYLLKPFALAAFVELVEEVLRETGARCERDSDAAKFHPRRDPDDRLCAGDVTVVPIPSGA